MFLCKRNWSACKVMQETMPHWTADGVSMSVYLACGNLMSGDVVCEVISTFLIMGLRLVQNCLRSFEGAGRASFHARPCSPS